MPSERDGSKDPPYEPGAKSRTELIYDAGKNLGITSGDGTDQSPRLPPEMGGPQPTHLIRRVRGKATGWSSREHMLPLADAIAEWAQELGIPDDEQIVAYVRIGRTLVKIAIALP